MGIMLVNGNFYCVKRTPKRFKSLNKIHSPSDFSVVSTSKKWFRRIWKMQQNYEL